MCEAGVGCTHPFLAVCHRWAQRLNPPPTPDIVAITTQKFRAVLSKAIHWGFWSLWCGEVTSLYALRDDLGWGETMTDINDASRLLSVQLQSAGLISCFHWAACFTIKWFPNYSLHFTLSCRVLHHQVLLLPLHLLELSAARRSLSVNAPLARVIKRGLKMDLWQLHSYFGTSCMLWLLPLTRSKVTKGLQIFTKHIYR